MSISSKRRKEIRRERKLPRMLAIYNAQDGRCYLCSKGIPHPNTKYVHHSEKASLDHVIPKNPDDRTKACKRIKRNALLAHHGCNNKKANRLPYPCEILFLEAVNDRLIFLKLSNRRRSRRY